MKVLKEQKLVIATHNAGKAKEIKALLSPYVDEFITAADLGLPEPEETGATFTENAILKAKAASQESGLPALADDSGLAVVVLGGEPGIYSARWAGPDKNFRLAMEKVHREMGNAEDRSAAFVCVLALALPDSDMAIFEGRIEGRMVWPPRGDKGFGYDPAFIPDGYSQTFGEMDPEGKHRISHRARAFGKLVDEYLKKERAE